MKTWKFKIIFALLFSMVLSGTGLAGSGKIGFDNGVNIKQDIKVYFVEDLRGIGYDIAGGSYQNISSDLKDKITTKLQAYLYKEAIGPVLELKDATTTDKLFSPDRKGYYLLVLDKKDYEGKVLVSKPVLFYYSGSDQMVKIKSELVEGENLVDLEVILHWAGEVLDDRVWIGLYDEAGQFIGEAWLSADRDWRHSFSGLDPLKNYSVWVEDIDGVFFSLNRVGNRLYIENMVIGNPDDIPGNGWWPGFGTSDPPIVEGGPIIGSEDDGDLASGAGEEVEDQPDGGQPEIDLGEGGQEGGLKPGGGEEKLPQTGLLWWPVPVLFAVGLFLFIISFRKEKDD